MVNRYTDPVGAGEKVYAPLLASNQEAAWARLIFATNKLLVFAAQNQL